MLVSLPISTMILLLQCDLSWGQMCSVSCTQTATVRNMPYEEAYEIVQNREWELEDDFGDDSILIRRYKRVITEVVSLIWKILLGIKKRVNVWFLN